MNVRELREALAGVPDDTDVYRVDSEYDDFLVERVNLQLIAGEADRVVVIGAMEYLGLPDLRERDRVEELWPKLPKPGTVYKG